MAKKKIALDEVICIKNMYNNVGRTIVQANKHYWLELSTIFGDRYGEWFGFIYSSESASVDSKVGMISLSHFRSA